ARAARGALMAAIGVQSLLAAQMLFTRYAEQVVRWRDRAGIRLSDLVGETGLFVDHQPLNLVLPRDAFAWLVGDAAVFYVDRRSHYTVVFNRDPWIEFAASHTPAECVAWLRERAVTCVVFNWSEIERLRKTYGFSDRVTQTWETNLESAGLLRVTPPTDSGLPSSTHVYRIP